MAYLVIKLDWFDCDVQCVMNIDYNDILCDQEQRMNQPDNN